MRQAIVEGKVLATVWFRGVELPPWARLLNEAASYTVRTEADGECASYSEWMFYSFWLLRFSYCLGRIRQKNSRVVKLRASMLRQRLIEDSNVWDKVRQEYLEADVVMDDWIRSLDIILQEAERAPRCCWYAGFQGPGPYEHDPSLAPPWPEAIIAHALAGVQKEQANHRTGSGTVGTPSQLEGMEAQLADMLDDVHQGRLDTARTGLRHIVADSWPTGHALAELVRAAEQTYERVARGGSA